MKAEDLNQIHNVTAEVMTALSGQRTSISIIALCNALTLVLGDHYDEERAVDIANSIAETLPHSISDYFQRQQTKQATQEAANA